MSRKILIAVVLGSFILLSMAGTSYAQESSIEFEIFSLPGKDISSFSVQVAQDSTGFLWFATADGLYRYDGYSFTDFTHDPEDSTSLSSRYVETIYVDQEGTFWVGTYGGLNKFNPATESFSHFRHDQQNPLSLSSDSVTAITEDHYGNLWVGTSNGLNQFDAETNSFKRYHYDPNDTTSLGNNEVRSLYVDSQGTLWIGTIDFTVGKSTPGPGGLNRFNRDTDTFTRYLHNPNDSQSLMSNIVTSMFEDSRGTFWVGTHGNVLHKMNRETGQFERLIYSSDEPEVFQSPTDSSLPISCVDFFCGAVTSIEEDPSGSIWIGFLGEGLIIYDPELNTLKFFDNNTENFSGFSTNNIWNIFQSKDGTLWIPTLLTNVTKAVLPEFSSGKTFESQNLPITSQMGALHIEESGTMWLGEFSYLRSLTPGTMNAAPYQINANIFFQQKTVGSIFQSRDSTLWVGAFEGPPGSINGGLYTLNYQTEDLEPVFVDADHPDMDIGPIINIYEDPNGIIWLGTLYTGFFRFDRRTGSLTQFAHDANNPNSLIHNDRTIIHGSNSEQGILWIGTERGLNRFDTKTETFTRYLYDTDNTTNFGIDVIKSIFEDSQNRLWIGTHSTGLIQFEPTSEQFTRYTTYNSGISGNNVACILESSDGSIWIGTNRGLTRLNTESEFFYTYDENHGVYAAPFLDKCSSDVNGHFIFAGNSQVVVFNPNEVQPTTSHSTVVLTGFYVDNQPVRFGSEGPLQTPLWMAEQIELPFSQNTFALEFSVLDYRNSDANRYAYRLEGYDESWRESGNLRRASYERIPAGDYVFRVRAANSDGIWNVEGASIGITILPPWWETWWAYGLYALIFAAGVFAVDRFQRQRLIKREREKARERELEQAREIEKAYHNLEIAHENLKSAQDQLVQQEKLASLGQLTAGIAHEIKNPLNFVNNFSDLSIELVDEARDEVKASMKSHFEGGKIPSNRDQGDDPGTKSEVNSSTSNTPLNPLSRGEEILAIIDDIEANLRKIHEHGTRADGIVKSMLQHSRGGSGKMEPTDVNALIKEYANLAFHGMRAGKDPINVDIELDLDENVGEIEMIGEDFSRVILNLCNNAFDAMREKLSADSRQLSENPDQSYEPKLTIKTFRKDSNIAIEIQDNGPGISDEIKDKILQPFFTTKKGTAGTGLGLSITNDIIKAHGGNLAVDTNTSGTTFTITINP